MSIATQLIFIALAILRINKIHQSVENIAEPTGTYDYIVVGLGSAGSIVAARLAENPNIRVLGLEAGISQSVFTDIPAYYLYIYGTEFDWQFLTTPQERMGFAYQDHRMSTPRGKVIGGTSTINYMVYNRGNRRGYDNWNTTYGATGWDYESVLPYFIKAENNTNLQLVRDNPGYHGTKGPVGISIPTQVDPILLKQQEAINELLNYNAVDYNGASQLGTAICQMTINEGRRSSTGNAYLEPNPHPDNLFISINSLVSKVLIENSTAVGVEYIKNNIKHRVYAKIEVIVCAGAIKSPQLLMLSGIGPKDHLNKFDIPVIADLPVGNNHKGELLIYEVYAICKNASDVITPNPPPELTIPDLYQLFATKSGVLANQPFGIAYYSTKYDKDKNWPSTILFSIAAKFGNEFSAYYSKYAPSIQDSWNAYYSQFTYQNVISFIPFVGRTYSAGTVRLNSTDPFDKPLINPKVLSDIRDLRNFIEITRLAFLAIENSCLSQYVTLPEPIPGCCYCDDRPVYECDSYIECLIRQIGITRGHAKGGTCRMGSITRNDVVVDERLRVKGIKKLRVCDISIIPEQVNSNFNAVAMMCGERGAAIIKEDNP